MSKSKSVYQLKIQLKNTPVWRRIALKANANLNQLHQIIQTAMGWENCHLHMFTIRGVDYEDHQSVDECLDSQDENSHKLYKLASNKDTFIYTYDYGNSWEHTIKVESIHSSMILNRPVCLDGAKACPPEDCGGPFGYLEILGIITDANHPEHRSMLTWVGKGYNPKHFNLHKVNQRFKQGVYI